MNSATGSVSGSANNLTLNLSLSFQAAFAGAKNIYMSAHDSVDSGWQQKGTWTPSTGGTMGPVSVTPGSGSGSSQTFGFVFSDPQGYGALNMVRVLFNNTLAGPGSCYLLYYPGSNVLYLANDAGTGWAGPATIGQSGSLQNSQCSMNSATGSVSGSANNLTLNLSLSFQAAFAGAKNIYMSAYDGVDSGWQQKGTWTPQNGPIIRKTGSNHKSFPSSHRYRDVS